MKKILIIGTKHVGSKNDPMIICDKLQSRGLSAKVVFWEDITVSIVNNVVKLLIDNADIIADKPDLVMAFGWYKNGKKSIYRDLALAVALCLEKAGIPYWNSEMGHQRSTTKLSTLVQLALNDVPVPDTYFSIRAKKNTQILSVPFIVKATSASRGRSNYLIKSASDIAQIDFSENSFLFQPFLPNDHDLRVICFGGQPTLILKRSRQAGADTHLNNTSQGGSAQWLELSSVNNELLTIATKICKVTGREMAGIDFIPDAKSSFGYSCLEVNAIPQLTSGVDSDMKIEMLANNLLEK